MPAAAPRRYLLFLLPLLALLLAACGGGSDRPTLTVFAAASLSDVFEQAAERFEQQEDVRVRFAFGGSQRLRLQLEQGAQADIFASADDRQMQRLIDAGLVDAVLGEDSQSEGLPVNFAANALVLIVPTGSPLSGLEDLFGADGLPRDGLRLVVAAPEVPAGRLTRAILEERGESVLLDAVVSEEDNVRAVLTKVTIGEADAGFVYASDARSAVADVRAFDLGSALRNRYQAAPLADADQPDLAARFLAFLQQSFVESLLAEAGFQQP